MMNNLITANGNMSFGSSSALAIIKKPLPLLNIFHPSTPFFYRRFLCASLLLPSLYFLLPVIFTTLFSSLSLLSYNHEYIILFLSAGITKYVRHLIETHAPDSKSRREALAACTWKLPLLSIFGSLLLFHFLMRLVSRESVSANDGGWDVVAGCVRGVKLSLSGLVLSLVTMVRYVGPFSVVKCSNSLAFINPYESLFQSFLPTIDYFLQKFKLPPTAGVNYLNPTLYQIIIQFIIHIGLGVILGVVNLVIYNTESSMMLISTMLITFYTWMDHFIFNEALEIDIDLSFQLDSRWLLHVWQERTIQNKFETQMRRLIPSLFTFCLFHTLYNYGISGIPRILFASLPSLIFMSALSCLHLIITNLLLESFLSQNINMEYLSPSNIIKSIASFPRNILTSILDETSNEKGELDLLKDVSPQISESLLQTPTLSVSYTLMQVIMIKSLSFSKETENVNPMLALHILRYLSVYITALAKTLQNLPQTSSSCIPRSTLTFLRHSLQCMKTLLSYQKRHSPTLLILPTLVYVLYHLHLGILIHGKQYAVDQGNGAVRRAIALRAPLLGTLLRELESIALEFEGMKKKMEVDTYVDREVEVWVESLKRREG